MRLNQEETEKRFTEGLYKLHMVRLQEMNEYVCLSWSETDYQSANRNPDNVTRLISM